jgi:excisionase family DNA binding protein
MNWRALANQATIREAAEIIGVPFYTLRNAVRKGAVPHEREQIGKSSRIRLDLEDVEAWNITRRMGRPAIHEYSGAEAIAWERGILLASARRALQRGRAA